MKIKKYLIIPVLLFFVISTNCNEDECEPYALSSNPGLEFISVPPIGSEDNLTGRVKGVRPEDYRVAVYIYVSGWWNKPYFDNPLTVPECNSNFNCDITTGGIDPSATKIRAYLVTKNYDPPLIEGGNIPNSIEEDALARIEVIRGN